MNYGHEELIYAEPFANALVNNPAFKAWVLSRTSFAPYANEARLLSDEMRAKRKLAKYWWRSHYTEACRCAGCSGRETDILAVFETSEIRFALHIEVKHPFDRFSKPDQAQAYPVRAKCWSMPESCPPKIVPHSMATTMLLFSENKRQEFQPHINHFDSSVTFEDIGMMFPEAVPNPGAIKNNLPLA